MVITTNCQSFSMPHYWDIEGPSAADKHEDIGYIIGVQLL